MASVHDRRAAALRPAKGEDLRAETAPELSHLIFALWKLISRATPAYQQMPVLESQVQILRQLAEAGPMSPAAVADELRLARSTISNLVRDLVDTDMIERLPSSVDGRSVLLAVTDHGRTVLDSFRRDRAQVLETGLEAVPQEEMERLAAALPALAMLLAEFQRITDEAAGFAPRVQGSAA